MKIIILIWVLLAVLVSGCDKLYGTGDDLTSQEGHTVDDNSCASCLEGYHEECLSISNFRTEYLYPPSKDFNCCMAYCLSEKKRGYQEVCFGDKNVINPYRDVFECVNGFTSRNVNDAYQDCREYCFEDEIDYDNPMSAILFKDGCITEHQIRVYNWTECVKTILVKDTD